MQTSASKVGRERGVAIAGALSSLAALGSAAACCVLPLALAGVGIGAAGLTILVPYRWPLTVISVLVVAAGWALHARKRRACGARSTCDVAPPPGRTTPVILAASTLTVAISAAWSWIEPPLMRALGGP